MRSCTESSWHGQQIRGTYIGEVAHGAEGSAHGGGLRNMEHSAWEEGRGNIADFRHLTGCPGKGGGVTGGGEGAACCAGPQGAESGSMGL